MQGSYPGSADMKHLEMALYMRRLHLLVAECAALTTPQIKVVERVLGCVGRRFSGNAVLAHDVCRVREALYACQTGKRPGQHAVIASMRLLHSADGGSALIYELREVLSMGNVCAGDALHTLKNTWRHAMDAAAFPSLDAQITGKQQLVSLAVAFTAGDYVGSRGLSVLYSMCECPDARGAVVRCGGISAILHQAVKAARVDDLACMRTADFVILRALFVNNVEDEMCMAELFRISRTIFKLLRVVQVAEPKVKSIAVHIFVSLMQNIPDGVCECLHASTLLSRCLGYVSDLATYAPQGLADHGISLVCAHDGALFRTRFYSKNFCKSLRSRMRAHLSSNMLATWHSS